MKKSQQFEEKSLHHRRKALDLHLQHCEDNDPEAGRMGDRHLRDAELWERRAINARTLENHDERLAEGAESFTEFNHDAQAQYIGPAHLI